MSQQNNRLDALLARNSYVPTPSSHRKTLTVPVQSKYQQTYTPPRPLDAIIAASLPGPAGITIISCADPRVIPEEFLGFSRGECAVIRNAGGRAAEALSSIIVLDSIIPMQAVAIIHHTDCGVTHVTDASIRARLSKLAPGQAEAVSTMDFGTFETASLEASVIEDMCLVRASPYIRNEMPVRGFVLDIETGVLREVEVDKVGV
ncbi:carbonic anhydrase [Athelia psychrophila]|uniref:Carbonic anhydrase n=1 Tax=Athelia psychrophila TaxID=1759441 RepID=A0A166JK31_9AGAM|nr:carbonic anhydrase [Fibularhizoctonia sp. CBS 109695]